MFDSNFGLLLSLVTITGDVTLVADGVDFPSHRAVLAACSPYFYAMFTNDVAEARTPSITLQNIDSKAMQLLMDFIYTSEIRVTEDNVQVGSPLLVILYVLMKDFSISAFM